MADRRFGSGFGGDPTAEPGLVLEDDDIVYIVKPDGTRIPAGSGGSVPDPIVADVTIAPTGNVPAGLTAALNVIAQAGVNGIIVFPDSAEGAGNSGIIGLLSNNAPDSGGGAITLDSRYGISVQTGDTSANGAEPLAVKDVNGLKLIGSGDAALGFFGATPATRPAAPVTLGDVIAALKTLGLVAP
jgi:hypothetical protein